MKYVILVSPATLDRILARFELESIAVHNDIYTMTPQEHGGDRAALVIGSR